MTARGPITATLAGRLRGKMKIRGVMARKGDTPEYVCRMQKELFKVLAEAKSLGRTEED